MSKKPTTETLGMKKLFEQYYAMGDSRSLAKLQVESGASITSIKRYSSAFNWTERVLQRDLANSMVLERRTNEAVINTKVIYRQTIKTLTDKFIQDVKDGKIKMRSILDFERIVRLDMDLMGIGAESEMVDNVATLAEALKSSGFDNIKDPDVEEE